MNCSQLVPLPDPPKFYLPGSCNYQPIICPWDLSVSPFQAIFSAAILEGLRVVLLDLTLNPPIRYRRSLSVMAQGFCNAGLCTDSNGEVFLDLKKPYCAVSCFPAPYEAIRHLSHLLDTKAFTPSLPCSLFHASQRINNGHLPLSGFPLP